ncbi:hypothetical protein CPB83DRAFT_903461 [Crepidotus variabilis]|uniref:Uncharacterized protein n=1 Tax=Crepidotus variabilis TaxID=179855 RepID=A0A9P6EPG1_9AGAR|nr:hypothetical protein CPB83DRAFT_903461 [Crepidotus variabilis]
MSEDYGADLLTKRKRKPNKRYVRSDDEDEEPSPVPAKAPRRNSTTRPRRRSTAAEDTSFREAETGDVDMNIDIEGVDDEDEELLAAASVGTSQSQSQNKPSKGRRSNRGKTQANGPPARKKSRNVVVSEEEEDDFLEAEAVPESDEERTDEDYYSEDERRKKGKGKASGGSRGTKRKANVELEGSSARPAFERKLSVDTRKKNKSSVKADESLQSLLDFSESVPTPDPSEKFSSPVVPSQSLDSPVPTPTIPAPAPPKKLKLPTIKKTKLPGTTSGPATGGTSTPTSATPKTKLPLDLGIGSNRKAHNATTDLDLSNKSIYQELFKTSTDGGTPRTGLNRRSKEEDRRKELNKQKEDYLAKQAEEALHSFDLQAPTDRISQFEEKLRTIKSGALYPQWLAGKWKVVYEREQYEKEKRKQKEQAQALIPVPDAPNGSSQEEGEHLHLVSPST